MTGRTYSVATAETGTLHAVQLQDPEMSSVEDLKIRYGTVVELADAGVTFARGEIDPGVEVPAHSGPNLYGLYVISGSGVLTLTDGNGNVTSQVPYAPDDLIIFEPGAMHGWRNDGETVMSWLGVDILKK